MRLVTHNLLKCNIKGVENGYPLTIVVEKMEIVTMDYNPGLNFLFCNSYLSSISSNSVLCSSHVT